MWASEWPCPTSLTEYSFVCENFPTNRLGSTALHYLVVRLAVVNVHSLVHSKITLTYLLTWQTDSCTPGEWLSRCYVLHAKSILSHTFSYKSSWALYVHEDDILSSIIGYSLTLYWHNTGSFFRRVWSLTRTGSCFSTISACKLFLKSITGGQENSLHDYHCNITCANEYDTPVLKYSFVVLGPTVMRHFDKHMKHSYILLTLWMRQVTVN